MIFRKTPIEIEMQMKRACCKGLLSIRQMLLLCVRLFIFLINVMGWNIFQTPISHAKSPYLLILTFSNNNNSVKTANEKKSRERDEKWGKKCRSTLFQHRTLMSRKCLIEFQTTNLLSNVYWGGGEERKHTVENQ